MSNRPVIADSSAASRVLAASAAAGEQGVSLIFAPGRINLIGDHIDYVGGTVLPMSVSRGTWVAASAASTLVVHALDSDETRRFPDSDLPMGHWGRFVQGLLEIGGYDGNRGASLHVSGELQGGGLSSSASFCLAVARALMDLEVIPRVRGMTLARLAQAVEHEWLEVPCGLMDQVSVVAGTETGALAFDTATGRVSEVPFEPAARCVVAVRSRADRTLADGAYATRRRELAEGLERLGKPQDRIPELSRAGLQDVEAGDVPLRRVRHIVTEQRLVHEALDAARNGNWPAFGACMSASHASLRDDYEVSVPELDRMVEAMSATPGCDGARLSGAGFGGWVIALLERDALESVLTAAAQARGIPLEPEEWFVARPGGCVRAIESDAFDHAS